MAEGREYRNGLYGDYTGMTFPGSLQGPGKH